MRKQTLLSSLSSILLLVALTPVLPAQNGSVDVARAHDLLEEGKIPEAIRLLQDVAVQDPQLKGVDREMGVAYYRNSDYSQAISHLKRALDQDKEDKEAIQLLGLSYYFAGKFADAIPLLERAQAWYSVANVDASYVLGLCYILTQNYDGARTAFAKMFGVSPESAASYFFTARMLLRQDFGAVAENYAHTAIEKDPKLPMAHALLGEIYFYQSKVEDSIVQFQKELEINPGSAETYYKLADAYSRNQRFDDAQKLLQRSIWLDSNATGPYVLLGQILAEKGETELAVRTLQRALAMDPNNPVPHYLLGRSYRKLGRNEDAEREMKLVVQLREAKNSKP